MDPCVQTLVLCERHSEVLAPCWHLSHMPPAVYLLSLLCVFFCFDLASLCLPGQLGDPDKRRAHSQLSATPKVTVCRATASTGWKLGAQGGLCVGWSRRWKREVLPWVPEQRSGVVLGTRDFKSSANLRITIPIPACLEGQTLARASEFRVGKQSNDLDFHAVG